jgi:hypothetical protein
MPEIQKWIHSTWLSIPILLRHKGAGVKYTAKISEMAGI